MPTLLVYALVALALLVSGFGTGWEVKGWKDDAAALRATQVQGEALRKAQEDARALGVAEGQITFTAAQRAAEQEVKIVTRVVTQVKEVPVYVSQKASSACVVNNGFVQLHNAGAAGVDNPSAAFPLPAGQSVDSPAGVDLAAVASTVRENYGKCEANANRLTALQGWVKDQKALQEKPK